jgi:uncharacterized membrane protein (UPF0182 family)
VARINQDQAISPQITLWNQQGSTVTWGTLMVIPIQESLIYVRPLYLRAAGGRIPELTRVVVVYQNQIVMEATLDMALERLFGERAPTPEQQDSRREPEAAPDAVPVVAPSSADGREREQSAQLEAYAIEARAHFERALTAQRAGDWAKYGEEIRLLGETLSRMRR